MNERRRILEMVKEGKITPEEGERLLDELERAPRGPARLIRVRLESPSGHKMQFSLPVPLASSLVGLVPADARERLRTRGVDLEQVLRAVQEGAAAGPVVDIREPSGASVEIIVE